MNNHSKWVLFTQVVIYDFFRSLRLYGRQELRAENLRFSDIKFTHTNARGAAVELKTDDLMAKIGFECVATMP